jgi:hypothetical protein
MGHQIGINKERKNQMFGKQEAIHLVPSSSKVMTNATSDDFTEHRNNLSRHYELSLEHTFGAIPAFIGRIPAFKDQLEAFTSADMESQYPKFTWDETAIKQIPRNEFLELHRRMDIMTTNDLSEYHNKFQSFEDYLEANKIEHPFIN